MREKKVRGLKRKTKKMIQRIKECTLDFPQDFHNGYWNVKLPVAQSFINSSKIPMKIKRLGIQTLIDRMNYLINLKPNDKEQYRVVVVVFPANVWNSQIIIFKGESYFKDFFTRKGDYQRWIPQRISGNILQDWGLTIPTNLHLSRFKEIINDGDGYYEGDIYFIGELV